MDPWGSGTFSKVCTSLYVNRTEPRELGLDDLLQSWDVFRPENPIPFSSSGEADELQMNCNELVPATILLSRRP